MASEDATIAWLLDSDPAIRWQAMRDLLDAPQAEWAAERAKVETVGWGAELLARQDADGQWAGGAFVPHGFEEREWKEAGQPWTATSFALTELRHLGLDPTSDRARRTVAAIAQSSHWEEGGQPFWQGETEECINGRIVADGAYYGVDVSLIVRRLLGECQEDGGWNCERRSGSTRSSFASTINVLEGLLAYERAVGGDAEVRAARLSAEEYLLQRGLFRRRGSGEPADSRFLSLLHPHRWRYDILRALEHFRAAGELTGTPPDPRLGDAISHLRARRLPDGSWPLDWTLRGRTWIAADADSGRPSRWLTLRALRVLRWWDGR